MIEANLLARIAELEQALRNCRRVCVDNLHNPGNEYDSLEYVANVADSSLHDTYVYVEDEDD